MTTFSNPGVHDTRRAVEDAKVRLLAWAQQVDDEAEGQAAKERLSNPMHGLLSTLGAIVASGVLKRVEESSPSSKTRIAMKLLRYAMAARLFTPLIKMALASGRRT